MNEYADDSLNYEDRNVIEIEDDDSSDESDSENDESNDDNDEEMS